MAKQLSRKPEITLIDVLPHLFKYADLAKDMPHIRLISKACAGIAHEACLRFKLKFESGDDCMAGTKFVEQVLAKNKNIERLAIDIREPRRMKDFCFSRPPPKLSPEEIEAYALPLQCLFAASPTQWPNLKELYLVGIASAAGSFGTYTSAHFPNLEHLLLWGYTYPEDFQLELPKLVSFQTVGESCLTSKALTEIVCNQSLPSLTDLSLEDNEFDDWSAFKGIEHRNIKHLTVEVGDHRDNFLDILQRCAEKALQSLESLHIYCPANPSDINPLNLLFANNTNFKNLKVLSLEFIWFFEWRLHSPAAFIKLARACPNLKTLSLGDWLKVPEDNHPKTVEEYWSQMEEILQFRERLSDCFEVFAEENAREPLLPHIQEMDFENKQINAVHGMPEVLYDCLIKPIWPDVLFIGNNFKSV